MATTPDSRRGGSLRFRWRQGQHVLVWASCRGLPYRPAQRWRLLTGSGPRAATPSRRGSLLCAPPPVLRPCA